MKNKIFWCGTLVKLRTGEHKKNLNQYIIKVLAIDKKEAKEKLKSHFGVDWFLIYESKLDAEIHLKNRRIYHKTIKKIKK